MYFLALAGILAFSALAYAFLRKTDSQLVTLAPTATAVSRTAAPAVRDEVAGVSTTAPTATPSPTPSVKPTTAPTSTASSSSPTDQGDAAYSSGNYADATSDYRLAISQESQPWKKAILYYKLGNSLRESNSLNEAISAYNSSLQLDQKSGDTYLNKAAIQWQLGKKTDAKQTLSDGISQGASRSSDLQQTLDVYKMLP
jgi:tetratricopeptide (TPR) repeat protein